MENLAISFFVKLRSEFISKYSPLFLVTVMLAIGLRYNLSPFLYRSNSYMMEGLIKERRYENRLNLNPGCNSSVCAAPPTMCLLSRTSIFDFLR